MKKIKIRMVFTEELLGTASNNPSIHEEFIASKSADKDKIKEELAALHANELVDKAKTIFPRDEDGTPFMYDYMIKGFFKDACSALSRVKDSKSKTLRAYKKIIDGLIFPSPRKIRFNMPEHTKVGECPRPLRGQTAQGERISLANSETVPAGTWVEFELKFLEDSLEPVIMEWLEYGELKGIGGWRNSGKGRFSFSIK